MSGFNFLKVVSANKITSDAIVLSFEIPKILKNKYEFIPGQYLTLELIIDNVKVRRSYSICSGPDEILKVGIKKIPKGVFSNYVFNNIKIGDIINVSYPEGRFTFNSNGNKEVITGIAAGSGITPILSIAKSVLNSNKKNEFRLIYANKSLKDEMFSSEIQLLKDKFLSRLKVINIYSQSNEKESLFGRIDNSIINHYESLYGLADKYFICGPEEMIHSVADVLFKNNISKENLLYELFKTNTEKIINQNIEERSTLEIIYDGVKYELNNINGKTVLDAALESEIDVPYSCQGGVCSSCIARVIEGSAKMKSNQILTDEEVKEGLILTCQAIIENNFIKVDYDDV